METTAVKVEKGRILWHELLTNDADAAIDFYTHVIGWKTQPYDFEGADGPPYTMWMSGETPVGGVTEIDPESTGDVPPHWTGYVHTPDVDATLEKAKTLGGSVIAEAIEVPTVGRMAGLADPQGASIWILAPSSKEPMPEPPRERSFSWNELATTDSAAALDFYRKLFDWEKQDELDMGDGWMYRMFGQREKMYGGIYNKPPDMPAPPHWLYYVNVDGLEAAIERATERGAKILNGPMEVPGGDRIVQGQDPEGVAFALHETKK